MKVQQNLRVQHSFHQTNKPSKMTPMKQQQIGSLLRDIENNVEKLYQKERKLEKRSNYDKDRPVNGNKISVENPLFGRDCFPTLRKPPKLSKGNEGCGRLGCRLPQLH